MYTNTSKYIQVVTELFYWSYTISSRSFKGKVSDSNNILLWHESEDVNQKKIKIKKIKQKISKFNWFKFYVYKWCMIMCNGIDYHVKFILADENLYENRFYFTLKWFLLNSFWEMCLLEESYKNMQQIQIFDIFESPLCTKSGCTLLITQWAFSIVSMKLHKWTFQLILNLY